MATQKNQFRDYGDRKNHQKYHERNRTYSSTSNDYYKNKLEKIGIEKDLRELLERKKLNKEQELPGPTTQTQDTRKVRFNDNITHIRRSKSFTSGTDNNYQKPNKYYREEQNTSFKYNKTKKTDYFDLHNPTNIKIELKTDSGDRKCTVDLNTPIPDVKCDLRNSRNILKNLEQQQQKKPNFTKGGPRRSFKKDTKKDDETLTTNKVNDK